MKRLVILGGGFGGLEAARAARKLFEGEIVLIDHSPVMTFHGHLHEIVSERIKEEEIEIPLKEALDKIAVNFLQAEIKGLKKGFVETNKGKVKYDSLIIAMGSKTCFAVKGIRKCDELKQSFHAKAIHDHLMKLQDATIAVVGAGLTGTELVFEIKELGKKHKKNYDIHLIEASDGPMPHFPEKARNIAKKEIEKLEIKEHYNKKIIFSDLHKLTFDDKTHLKFDLLIWTAGIEPATNAKMYGMESNKGFIKVDNFLQTSEKGVFAIGDIAWFDVGRSHEIWTAITAKREGKTAGINAANYLNGKRLKRYEAEKKHLFLISLGKNKGILVYGEKVIEGKLPIKIKTEFRKWYLRTRK